MDCDSERIWKMVEKYTLRDKAQRRPDSLNIYDNLYNCYTDNYQTCPDKRFRTGVNLLQKLPPELAVVSLVIKLYGDEDGYSVALGPNDQKEVLFPYEDNEIFSYLDAGEIPPVLLEVIENTNFCHFYNGCLVCEVRNYRIPQPREEQLGDNDSNMEFESIHVLLKASQETISRYVNEVCSDRHCSAEERLTIESKLLLATQQSLCLEPEIDVVCVQNRLHYNRRKYNKLSFKRYVRKHSHARRARIEMALGGNAPLSLKLIQFIQDRRRSGAAVSKPPMVLSFGRKKGLMKIPCALEELLQEVTKSSKSYQSDVQSLIQLRNEINANPTNQQSNPVSSSPAIRPVPPLPITTTSSTTTVTPKVVKPVKEPPPSPLHLPSTTIPPHSKPTDTTMTAQLQQPQPPQSNPNPMSTTASASNTSSNTSSGPLTVSLPRSLASVQAVNKMSSSKKTASSKAKKPRTGVSRPNVLLPRPPPGPMPRPPPGPMPRPPHGSMPRPGKTTIRVISTSVGGAPRMMTPPSIPNLLPKLHNPTIGMKTALPPSQSIPTGSMPRLKPLEAHKVTPPPTITLNKPPPLAPRPNSPAVPPSMAIKQPPIATSASLMPQLHKIQHPTSSDQSNNSSQ